MEGSNGSSRTYMTSKNDQLNLDLNEPRNGHQDPTESVLRTYAGKLYDRVDMACHFHQCEQISYFNCQQLYFYPFGSDTQVVHDRFNSPMSKKCEYCHSETKCRKDCQRPALYSQKRRPPFANDDGWDEFDFPLMKESEEQNNHYIPPKSAEPTDATGDKGSWISGFFESF